MSEVTTLIEFHALEDLLKHQFRSKVRNVRVLEREGKVVVQGTAVSFYAKQLVQHLVLSVLRTRTLVNELEVQPPTLVVDGA
jgi:hypothetical protein